MEKRQLANGAITVWQEDGGMVIHHANGLTIALTPEEMTDLFIWMNEQGEQEQYSDYEPDMPLDVGWVMPDDA